jgi:ribosomal protein S18 acetylase RimI-like enzyme
MDANPKSGVTIRQAKSGDEYALSLLGATTFLETYAELLPGPDLVQFTQTKHSLEHYAAWLADPAITVWLAESPTKCPVGYLVLTPATLPIGAPDPRDLEIQRIYVMARNHRTGLGHRLMNLALSRAASSEANRVVLGVHNDNVRALAFYRRQGFDVIDGRKFQVGETLCCDSVLARAIGVAPRDQI